MLPMQGAEVQSLIRELRLAGCKEQLKKAGEGTNELIYKARVTDVENKFMVSRGWGR